MNRPVALHMDHQRGAFKVNCAILVSRKQKAGAAEALGGGWQEVPDHRGVAKSPAIKLAKRHNLHIN
jgi:hypothetical protein